MKRSTLYLLLFVAICMVVPMIAHAQSDPPPPNDAPIDGGLSLLLAAGVGYGVKRYRDGKNKLQPEEEKV